MFKKSEERSPSLFEFRKMAHDFSESKGREALDKFTSGLLSGQYAAHEEVPEGSSILGLLEQHSADDRKGGWSEEYLSSPHFALGAVVGYISELTDPQLVSQRESKA